MLQGATSLALPHTVLLDQICKKGGQHVLSEEIERALCADVMSYSDDLAPDSTVAAVGKRARYYSGCGGLHASGALMATTRRVNRMLSSGERDKFSQFVFQQQLDVPLSLARVFDGWTTCPCCGLDISADLRGHHVLSCSKAGNYWRLQRHQMVLRRWSALLTRSGCAHTLGPNNAGLAIDPTRGDAPDIFQFDIQKNGRPVASDVSIVTAYSQAPSQKGMLQRAAFWPATRPERCPFLCGQREAFKTKKYTALCTANHWTFLPLVFSDVCGLPGPGTLEHVRLVAKQCKQDIDPFAFWTAFRSISAAVSLGTFKLAMSIRAEMLAKNRQRGVRRGGQQQRSYGDALSMDETFLPPPEKCDNAGGGRLDACPVDYRNSHFISISGDAHWSRLSARFSEAVAIIITEAAAAAAATPPVVNAAAVAACRAQVRAARSAAPPVAPASALASSAPSPIPPIAALAAHPAASAAFPTPSIGGRVPGPPAFLTNPLAGTGGFATSVSTVAGGQGVGASSVLGLLAASRAAALGALSPLGSAPHSGDLVDSPPSRSKVPQNPSSSLSQSAPAVVLASALALSAPSPISSISARAAHPAASAASPTPSIGGRVSGSPAFQRNPLAGTGGFATSLSTVAGGQSVGASSVHAAHHCRRPLG